MSVSNRLHVASENVTGHRKLSQNEAAPVRPRRIFGEFSNLSSNTIRPKYQLPGKNETLLKSSQKIPLEDENAPLNVQPKKLGLSKPSLKTQKDPARLKDAQCEQFDSWNRKDENKLDDFFKSDYSLDLGKSELNPFGLTPDNNAANVVSFDFKEDSIGLILDDLALNLNSSISADIEDPILDLDEMFDTWEKDSFSRKPDTFNSFHDSKYDLELGKKELEPVPFSKSDVRRNGYQQMMTEPLNFGFLEKLLEIEEPEKEDLAESLRDLAETLNVQLNSVDIAELLT